MKNLREVGVFEGTDEEHKQNYQGNYREDPAIFFNGANALLKVVSPVVVESVLPKLDEFKGRWNPGGFMVFPLGMHEIGSVRLHIWPDGGRETALNGPHIHNHAWHLASRVISGSYKDSIMTLLPDSNQDDPSKKLFVYKSQLDKDGNDVLLTDMEQVTPLIHEERKFTPGQIHNIPAGVFHLPTVSNTELTSTVVIDSPAFEATSTVIMPPEDQLQIERISRRRHLVSSEEAKVIGNRIIGLLGS